jgi:hypothetical protein
MSGWKLALVAAIYLWQTVDYLNAGRTGMALAFTGYALANLGFILDLK